MLNSFTNINPAKSQEDISLKTEVTSKKTKATKKTKKKMPKSTSKRPVDITKYKDLDSRDIRKTKDTDRSINAFKARTAVISQSFEKENHGFCHFSHTFPRKNIAHDIYPELNDTYDKLAHIYAKIEEIFLYRANNRIVKEEVEEIVIELLEIKQQIITIWNKYNPTTSYKHGSNSLEPKLEDKMLDFIQSHLFNCYLVLDDHKNKQLVIDQLIKQKSHSYSGILSSYYATILTDNDNLDNLNFKAILSKFTEIEESCNKVTSNKNYSIENRYNSMNQLIVLSSMIKMFLQKSNSIDYCQLSFKNKIYQNFITLVGLFTSYYQNQDDYIKLISKLSTAIDFYYSNLDKPIFKGIHTTLLSENIAVFLEKFIVLIKELYNSTYHFEDLQQQSGINKKRCAIVAEHAEKNYSIITREIAHIKQQITDLFMKYNIPTDDITSWYDIFISDNFMEVFLLNTNLVVPLVRWIDASKKIETVKPIDIKTQDNLNTWLKTLEKDNSKLVEDKIEWSEIPTILPNIFNSIMATDSLRFAMGSERLAKNKDLAIIHAKVAQITKPFLGTVYLAIANKDNYDELLNVLDMLEFISQQPEGKSNYIKNSKYLTAQIITHLIDNNHKLDGVTKQLLYDKAKKLYLELIGSGLNKAYILLAETTASLAKLKTHDQDFLEAANLYDEASEYCKHLSEIENLECELKDFAIINMNCFSAEAEILRKIDEEQKLLLKEPTTITRKTTTKSKKKSHKKIADTTKNIEPQEIAEEITTKEVVNWYKTHKATDSRPQNKTTTKVKTITGATKLPTRDNIASKRDFWQFIKELQLSSTNLEKSYQLLVKIIENDYYKNLESQFNNGINNKDSWAVLLIYQNIAYYHFLQQKHAKELGDDAMHLFYTKTKGAGKAEKVNFSNTFAEAEQIIRRVIKIICLDIPDIEIKNLRCIILSLSPANYGMSLNKNRLAATVSTYGHLISLDDISQGRRGKNRLAAKIYDKADEINPKRIIKKLAKKAS